MAVAFHEFRIVAFLFDDGMQHTENKGHVGAGSDREPAIGLGCGNGKSRIEADESGFAVHGRLDQVHGVGCDKGFEPVCAAENHVVGIEQIERRNGAEGCRISEVDRRETQRRMPHGIGRTEGIAEILEEQFLEALA